MTGTGSIPYDLHPWSPVVHADPGASLVSPISTPAAAGWAARTGAGGACTLLSAAATAAGRRATGGAAGSSVLPLTAAAGTGIVIATALSADGAPCLLVATATSGHGVKSLSLPGASQLSLLVVSTASGHGSKALRGEALTIATSLPLAAGERATGAPGTPAALTVATGPTARRRFGYAFMSPTHLDYRPLEPMYPALLTFSVPYGMTVWRDATGAWQTKYAPNPDRLIGATAVYEGGRQHWLSDAQRADLIDGGFADNIQLQEILW